MAFQGVRWRSKPEFGAKTEGEGPKMGVRLTGKVTKGLDGVEYLHVYETGLYIPMTNKDLSIKVLSLVLEADDITAEIDLLWDNIAVLLRPCRPERRQGDFGEGDSKSKDSPSQSPKHSPDGQSGGEALQGKHTELSQLVQQTSAEVRLVRSWRPSRRGS